MVFLIDSNSKHHNADYKDYLQANLNQSLTIIQQYQSILSFKTTDFHTENQWNQLPESWKLTFDTLLPEQLVDLFDENTENIKTIKKLWPLSILCLKILLKKLCISRENKKTTKVDGVVKIPVNIIHPKLCGTFKKHIKSKKQHEIPIMSNSCAQVAYYGNVKYIVDFGAGLGHLARSLGYRYGLNVCCLEQQERLTTQASVIDEDLIKKTSKYFTQNEINQWFCRPVHLNMKLSHETNCSEFFQEIYNSFKKTTTLDMSMENFRFGIIGLHSCGDLASILMNIFLKCDQAVFLNIVGCCYEKLTCKPNAGGGYPLSKYLKNSNFSCNILNYDIREVACHAQENFIEHLRNKNYEYLKIHSYRATIENIIYTNWPHLRNSGLRNIKFTTNLTFSEYCQNAVTELGIVINQMDINSKTTLTNLSDWSKLITIFTLRLWLAPLIESILLYDRQLFLIENDCTTQIEAIFDPKISPRNHVLTAVKHNYFTK